MHSAVVDNPFALARQGELVPQQLTEPWVALLRLLRQADNLPPNDFTERLRALPLNREFIAVLVEAVDGDNRPMNEWLFSCPPSYRDPLAWLAPVSVENASRFAWMVGFQSSLAEAVRELFSTATNAAVADPLLLQRVTPPPLLFVHPVEVSAITGANIRRNPDQDHFAIFQTNYRAGKAELNDLEQRFAINTEYLIAYRKKVLARARSVISHSDSLDVLLENLSLLAHVHTEGHNRGHFLGPWPLSSDKKCLLYEAVEEYRACVAAVRLAEHMGLASQQLDALAVSVFLVRFLGYGFDAFCLKQQRRRTVREITVGMMLFQNLLKSDAIQVSLNGDINLIVDPPSVRKVLINSLADIHYVEQLAVKGGKCLDHLRDLSRSWYGLSFPRGQYSREALAIYHHLLQKD